MQPITLILGDGIAPKSQSLTSLIVIFLWVECGDITHQQGKTFNHFPFLEKYRCNGGPQIHEYVAQGLEPPTESRDFMGF